MRLHDVYWYILVIQVITGAATLFCITAITLFIIELVRNIIVGLIIGITALISVVAYPSLFADVVYVNRANFDWNPYWWHYFGFGFGATFILYFLIVSADLYITPILIPATLIASTLFISIIYLYKRHKYVGTP